MIIAGLFDFQWEGNRSRNIIVDSSSKARPCRSNFIDIRNPDCSNMRLVKSKFHSFDMSQKRQTLHHFILKGSEMLQQFLRRNDQVHNLTSARLLRRSKWYTNHRAFKFFLKVILRSAKWGKLIADIVLCRDEILSKTRTVGMFEERQMRTQCHEVLAG